MDSGHDFVKVDENDLTKEQKCQLEKQDTRLVTEFRALKLEEESGKHWNNFYKRNGVKFFKDRHWAAREFDLKDLNDKILLEIGCGVGNFIFPLLEENPSLFVYACDFSPKAIQLVQCHPSYDEKQIKAFVADITKGGIEGEIEEKVDIVSLIFVLSAIHPVHYDTVVKSLKNIVKDGGTILFRDYGIYDMAQIRFKPGHKIFDNFYMRQDGTRSYFFTVDFVRDLFTRNLFEVLKLDYVKRRTVNIKEDIDVPRIFVQVLTALKKLKNNNKPEEGPLARQGLQTMAKSLQQKFARGVQYNMKIVIKGDRNVGKSCLFHRLQGGTFRETYVPTDEIQVANIQWNYKATDDVVKVEVWDVVDKGKKRPVSDNLIFKQGNVAAVSVTESPALDAEFLNVYKGAHGVIVVMDITKNWTFDYVRREMEKINENIPVLVLGNHCDMAHHRAVSADHVSSYVTTLNREAPIRYAEGSMYNGFGLKFLHKWFNLPFLQLQRETLSAQLATNEREIAITARELDLYQGADESNYSQFVDKLSDRRRKVAEAHSGISTSCVMVETKYKIPEGVLGNEALLKSAVNEATSRAEKDVLNEASVVGVKTAKDAKMKNNDSSNDWKNFDRGDNDKKFVGMGKGEGKSGMSRKMQSFNIEEFVPDDSMDKSFLDDSNVYDEIKSATRNDSDSESESAANPLVAEFQDDLDPDDDFPNLPVAKREQRNSSLGWSNCSTEFRRRSPEGGERSDDDDDDDDGHGGNERKSQAIYNFTALEKAVGKKKNKKSGNKKGGDDSRGCKYNNNTNKNNNVKGGGADKKIKSSYKKKGKAEEEEEEMDELEDFLNSSDAYEPI